MATYEVTFYYHTQCTVKVEASSEKEAIELGYEVNANKELLDNLMEDGAPDCELIDE